MPVWHLQLLTESLRAMGKFHRGFLTCCVLIVQHCMLMAEYCCDGARLSPTIPAVFPPPRPASESTPPPPPPLQTPPPGRSAAAAAAQTAAPEQPSASTAKNSSGDSTSAAAIVGPVVGEADSCEPFEMHCALACGCTISRTTTLPWVPCDIPHWAAVPDISAGGVIALAAIAAVLFALLLRRRRRRRSMRLLQDAEACRRSSGSESDHAKRQLVAANGGHSTAVGRECEAAAWQCAP